MTMPRPINRRILVLGSFLLAAILSSCGSGSTDSETSASDDSQVETNTNTGNGSGTITIANETFTFDLDCAFGEETMNEEASIGIIGTATGSTSSEIGMSFTEQWGPDFSTGKLSPDAPVNHSISIYKDSGRTVLYEYTSITRDPNVTKPLNVNGKTISGLADFSDESIDDPLNFDTIPGDVSLKCD